MTIKHPCAQADALWHKYVAVKRPSLLPTFEVRDLLIRVVTHRCGTGLSSCRCFLSHSSDCNWTGGVIFKHYFCVTGRDQPSCGGVMWGGACFATWVLSVVHTDECQPIHNARFNRKRPGNLKHICARPGSAFLCFHLPTRLFGFIIHT